MPSNLPRHSQVSQKTSVQNILRSSPKSAPMKNVWFDISQITNDQKFKNLIFYHRYLNLSRYFSMFPTRVEFTHFNSWYNTQLQTYCKETISWQTSEISHKILLLNVRTNERVDLFTCMKLGTRSNRSKAIFCIQDSCWDHYSWNSRTVDWSSTWEQDALVFWPFTTVFQLTFIYKLIYMSIYYIYFFGNLCGDINMSSMCSAASFRFPMMMMIISEHNIFLVLQFILLSVQNHECCAFTTGIFFSSDRLFYWDCTQSGSQIDNS